MCAVARYYYMSSKADRGDIFYRPRTKIVISHTPNMIGRLRRRNCLRTGRYVDLPVSVSSFPAVSGGLSH